MPGINWLNMINQYVCVQKYKAEKSKKEKMGWGKWKARVEVSPEEQESELEWWTQAAALL